MEAIKKLFLFAALTPFTSLSFALEEHPATITPAARWVPAGSGEDEDSPYFIAYLYDDTVGSCKFQLLNSFFT